MALFDFIASKLGRYRNCVKFSSEEMPDIKIDAIVCLKKLEDNVYSNSNKLEQLENQHAEIDKRWVEILDRLKNEHFSYDNLVILVEFMLCCPETKAEVERVFFSW
ncbi:uncharacterized protein TNCV_1909311 [Trichonephila clavipes]|nr:uncharacterized protein TNCV_1909311 [Trichonephila clavipes]